MVIHHDQVTIYFGSKKMSMQANEITPERLVPVHYELQNLLGAQSIYFCKQVHGAQGFHTNIEFMQNFPAFSEEADFLYSSEKKSAFGVITADCLPVVVYHPQGIVSVIHAGWKGSLENIVEKALYTILASCNTIKIEESKIFLGPSGKDCCYEVKEDFIQQFIEKYSWSAAFFKKQNSKIYFDNPGFTLYIVQKIGIRLENIYTKWNLCTICDENYCSYRREREKAGRNITLVMLKA